MLSLALLPNYGTIRAELQGNPDVYYTAAKRAIHPGSPMECTPPIMLFGPHTSTYQKKSPETHFLLQSK